MSLLFGVLLVLLFYSAVFAYLAYDIVGRWALLPAAVLCAAIGGLLLSRTVLPPF